MPDSGLVARARALLDACRRARLRLATVESCTGGLIAAAITEIAGSSDVLERGYVTYANEAKIELVGVPASLIAAHGAVSAEVAHAMAEGALAHAPVELSVSVTGIAGPGGATPTKPVGLVYIASARRWRPTLVERHIFTGDRAAIRLRAAEAAFDLLARRVAGE